MKPIRADYTDTACYNPITVSKNLTDFDEIAIFPLGAVLFPGAIMPLHIFEDRYKRMIRYAVEHGGLFGLSYRSDARIGLETPPEIGSIGCLAKINAVAPLEEGRVNIVAIGLIRYRVIGLRQSTPFVVARIEPLTDDLEPGEDLNRIFEDIVETCRQFMMAAQALDESTAPMNQDLPDEPEPFSLLVASALPIDNDAKQALLEMTSTRLRLTRLRPYVTSALLDYSDRIQTQQIAKGSRLFGNGFGRLAGGNMLEDLRQRVHHRVANNLHALAAYLVKSVLVCMPVGMARTVVEIDQIDDGYARFFERQVIV